MRFDRFRHRSHNPPPSPLPASAFRSTPSLTSSPTRWFSLERHRSAPTTPSPDSVPSVPKIQHPPTMSRTDYIGALEARMDHMEKVPTSSFYQTYAGEFDMLLSEDRRATRKMQEFETSTRGENACRNRYTNILSNEQTRVRLQSIPPGDNDYINANRVSGPDGHPGYIATQAPLPDTAPHFWQMVYESASPVIIMLTRQHEDHCDMTKCEQYWPDPHQSILFNDYMVQALDEAKHHHLGVIERRFQVGRVVDKRRTHARDLVHQDSLIPPASESASSATNSTSASTPNTWSTPARTRSIQSSCTDDIIDFDSDTEDLIKNLELIGPVLEVVQIQYIDWPDQDVPHTPATLLDMCRRVDDILRSRVSRGDRAGPPVVHCSAGVGRTGTFIAIDSTVRRLHMAFSRDPALAVGVDEIRELVRKLKRERSKMVQTSDQYRFIYQSVLCSMKRWEQGQSPFGNDGSTSPLSSQEEGTDRLRNGMAG